MQELFFLCTEPHPPVNTNIILLPSKGGQRVPDAQQHARRHPRAGERGLHRGADGRPDVRQLHAVPRRLPVLHLPGQCSGSLDTTEVQSPSQSTDTSYSWIC